MKRKQTIFTVLFLSAIFLFYIKPVLSDPTQTDVLTKLIEEGLESNPEVQAAYNSWKAALAESRKAYYPPDPMLKFTHFEDRVFTRIGPQEAKYGASQKIPFPGKLSLRGMALKKKADKLEEKYEAVKRELIKNIKFVYFDLYWIDKAIEITEHEKEVLENMEKVAQRKYETRMVPQQDAIKAGVEISKIIDKLYMLKQQRESSNAKLTSLLNRPKGSKLDRIKDMVSADFDYTMETLHKLGFANRQELLAANLEIEKAKYERSLAKFDFFPDLTVGIDKIRLSSGHTTTQLDGSDAWSATFSINVPLWIDKQIANLEEKNAKLETAKSHYENVNNVVAYEVEDLYYKINTYSDIVLLYKTALIPQTEQSYEAAKTGYETGGVDFLDWLDSERILLQTHLAYHKAIADYEKSIAYLERVVGTDL